MRWYPNAEPKCPGSFRVGPNTTIVDKNGMRKTQCHVCGRLVGFRNPRKFLLAQHKPLMGDSHAVIDSQLEGS